jgi:hypothetical protein
MYYRWVVQIKYRTGSLSEKIYGSWTLETTDYQDTSYHEIAQHFKTVLGYKNEPLDIHYEYRSKI